MLSLGSMFKMAKGGTDAEMIRGMLGAMGVDLAMSEVTLQDAPGELRAVAAAAGRRGASLHRLRGKMKDGATLEAFIVVTPVSHSAVPTITAADTIAA